MWSRGFRASTISRPRVGFSAEVQMSTPEDLPGRRCSGRVAIENKVRDQLGENITTEWATHGPQTTQMIETCHERRVIVGRSLTVLSQSK